MRKVTVNALFDAVVYDEDGRRVGGVESVYADDRTHEPTWVTVLLGVLGSRVTLIPLADAQIDGDRIQVPYPKSRINEAPRIDPRRHLYPNEERRLYEHYGGFALPPTSPPAPTAPPDPA